MGEFHNMQIVFKSRSLSMMTFILLSPNIYICWVVRLDYERRKEAEQFVNGQDSLLNNIIHKRYKLMNKVFNILIYHATNKNKMHKSFKTNEEVNMELTCSESSI